MNTREVIKNMQLVGGGLALLSVAGLAYAVNRGLNHRRVYKRNFNPDTVEEFKGKILEVDQSKEKNDRVRGKYLTLKTEDEIIPVHLGPAWFMDRQQHLFKLGDNIKVKGSRVVFKGADVIVATEIQQGNMSMKLRDEKGVPVWESWQKISK